MVDTKQRIIVDKPYHIMFVVVVVTQRNLFETRNLHFPLWLRKQKGQRPTTSWTSFLCAHCV
ncbi:hypothetical protein J6590_057289, partial [Homalodisca vitripennis]